MRFVVVNHRTPHRASTCPHCSRSLGAGYLRDVSSQRSYCDYDCYRRAKANHLFMPWLPGLWAASEPATSFPFSTGLMTSLAFAACLSYAIPLGAFSVALAQAALGLHDLMTPEGVRARRPG